MPPPPAVFRLVPRYEEVRAVLLDEASSLRLARWARAPGLTERPTSVSAGWLGDPLLPPGDYPCGLASAPIFSRRMVDRLGASLRTVGSLIPVVLEGMDDGAYELLLVERVADCLDPVRSSKPNRATRRIVKIELVPERIPRDAAAFRIPESPDFVFWNQWFVEELFLQNPVGVATLVVWSRDPAHPAFPNPMR